MILLSTVKKINHNIRMFWLLFFFLSFVNIQEFLIMKWDVNVYIPGYK